MHVCLFDIDGTLLSTGGAGQAAMEAALASEFGALHPIQGISYAGRTDRAITADIFAYYGIDDVPDNWERFLRTYLHTLPQFLQSCRGAVLPGIAALLADLARRDDVLLGLLTGNYREGARLKLTHYQLQQHFEFGGFGDRHHHRDDVARDALTEVRQRHRDVAPDRLWVVGDTPADVQCARAIGARVVAVATGVYSADELHATGPDFLFEDFSAHQTLLQLLA